MNRLPAVGVLVLLLCLCPFSVLAEEPRSQTPQSGKTPAEDETQEKGTQSEALDASVTKTLQGESGVVIQTMCTNCNSADLSMGGFSGEYIEMICDGLPVPPGLAQVYLLGVMPPTVLDNIEVEKGAGRSSTAGGAIGGKLILDRKRPERGFSGHLGFEAGDEGWRGGRLHLGLKESWFEGSLIGTYGRSSIVDGNEDGNPDLPSFQRRTIEGRGRFALSRDHVLRVGLSHYEEFQLDGPASYDFFHSTPDHTIYNIEDVDFDRQQYDLLYEGSFRDGSQVAVGALYSQRYSDIRETLFGPDTLRIPTYKIDEEYAQWQADYSRPVGTRMMLRAGVSSIERKFGIVDVRYNITQGNPFPEALDIWQHETIKEDGAWVESSWSLGRRVDLTVGARWVDFTYQDEESRLQWLPFDLPEDRSVLPRSALTFKPSPASTFRLTAGAGLQQPPPSYEEVCCGRRYRGNRGIKMEETTSFGAEYTYQPGARLKINASAFFTELENQVLNMAVLVYQYQPTYQHLNVPKSRIRSLSADARYSVNSWLTIKGAYSWQDHENTSADDALPALIDFFGRPMEYVFHSDELPYRPDSSASLGIDLEPVKGLAVSLSAQYTGQMLIQHFDAGSSGVAGSQLNPDFFPTEDFWVYNLYVSGSIGEEIELFAGMDNIGAYVQADLGDRVTDYNWGPLRGSYFYAGMTYSFGD